MGKSQPLFSLFSLFNTFDSKQILPMAGFELQISGVGSNRSTNWPTSTAARENIIWLFAERLSNWTEKPIISKVLGVLFIFYNDKQKPLGYLQSPDNEIKYYSSLVEWSLPTPLICCSNPAIGKICLLSSVPNKLYRKDKK